MQAVGASTTTGAFVGSASASQNTKQIFARVRKPYAPKDALQQIVDDRTDFLNVLSQDGLLDKPELKIEKSQSSCDYLESENGARVWGLSYPGEGPTAHITIRRKVFGGRLVISINPDLDIGPRALYKPDGVKAESLADGKKAVRYLARTKGSKPTKTEKTITTQSLNTLKQEHDTQGVSSLTQMDGVSPNGMIIGLCRNKGEIENCGSYSCYAWEGECLGDSCTLHDCSGNLCYDGCCTCEEEDWCCELCGDYSCADDGGTPCDSGYTTPC
ncbi:hypothetical protein [Haladaptatus cibarius]|uniref:hypothetical protein n=1 Tax=Haladaptatus cibarius TaxID=453847 RepID=UPI001185933B|nr:hypothetical protein [Haladaptatus cibarius]